MSTQAEPARTTHKARCDTEADAWAYIEQVRLDAVLTGQRVRSWDGLVHDDGTWRVVVEVERLDDGDAPTGA